jgi:hypothetical protein
MIRICWFIVVLTFAGACACRAAIITFDFTGTSPGTSGPWTATSASDPNLTLTSGFNEGSGITGNSGANRFNAKGWKTADNTFGSAISVNSFFTFTIQANSGYVLDISGATITLTLTPSTTGPADYALESSIGGFSTSSALNTEATLTQGSANNLTVVLPTSTTYDTSSAVEFRIYGYGTTGTSGATMSADAFSLGGTVTAVPETAAGGAIAGVGLLAIYGGRVWRQYRRGEKLKS